MKVYIRNTQTGWYYQEPSKWTAEQATACNLGAVARAVELIFEAHLENVEILLCYDDPRYDLVLPVPPSPSRPEPPKPARSDREDVSGEAGKAAPRHKKGPRL